MVCGVVGGWVLMWCVCGVVVGGWVLMWCGVVWCDVVWCGAVVSSERLDTNVVWCGFVVWCVVLVYSAGV